MLFRSLGDDAVSGLGLSVLGRIGGGDSEPPRPPFPDGELLRLLVCELGVTVSKAEPNGDELTVWFELGNVYGVNRWPPFRWLCIGDVGDRW